MNIKQYTFSEMSRKTVINVADGRELGHVCDMVFNNCGGVLGFVVPGKKSFFKSITSADNIFIAWNRIVKIGSDVILTEMPDVTSLSHGKQPSPYEACPPPEQPAAYAAEPHYSPLAAKTMEYADDRPAEGGAQTFYHTQGGEAAPTKYKEL